MIKLREMLRKFNNKDDVISYLKSLPVCNDHELLVLLKNTSFGKFFGNKKVRCNIDNSYKNSIKNWLELSDKVSNLKIPNSTLISGYIHQIANFITYEGVFGSENVGEYSGKVVGVPLPNIEQIEEWFKIYYKPDNIIRQILFAADSYYPVRVIEGKV